METRPFGKTGESFPILSFGGQRIVDDHDCTEAEAIEIVNTAIDRGIRYFDTAWIYSQGQAETRLGKVVKHRRAEMWIATKVWDTTRDGARRQLEENLAIAESFTPLTDQERLAFFQEIIPLVQPDNMRWKAVDWNEPTQWIPRRRGLEA